ncbi:PTS sugar transporter subunit IIA [Alkalibaculum sp. M08DMB]|uniref:PTS sugar transporter subunit IIA n=1 Tax=Alkalibaculum sporogenes TaxID=2655001 RepID=A0A6A7K9N1_9FIRM|nr:PTS sugar transporter subunit IIA [Alkalibaculum sporogenes]MPW26134.1 PTS sugar transporter subunit IIA [Alkalibaculum sporogenes]
MGMIVKELIDVSLDANDSEDAIKKVGKILFDQGYVKNTYINAVVDREKVFPTGLKLKSTSVAMPHTDSVHVNEPAICVARLNKPVTFCHMGSADNYIQVELIFMMAITDPNKQLDTLKRMMSVFQDDEAALEFTNARDNDELYRIAKKYLN